MRILFASNSSFFLVLSCHFSGAKVNPNSRNRLIYQFKAQTELAVGSEWTIKSAEVGGRSKAKLRFATRVICSDNYYGDQCSSYCRSRDDDHGHFFCTDKGKIVCLPGWEGIDNYCKTRKCFLLLNNIILGVRFEMTVLP